MTSEDVSNREGAGSRLDPAPSRCHAPSTSRRAATRRSAGGIAVAARRWGGFSQGSSPPGGWTSAGIPGDTALRRADQSSSVQAAHSTPVRPDQCRWLYSRGQCGNMAVSGTSRIGCLCHMPYVRECRTQDVFGAGDGFMAIRSSRRVMSPGVTGHGTLITIRVVVRFLSPGHSMGHALTQRHSSVAVRQV